MLTYNRKVITHNDKWFNEFIGHPEPVYHVYTSGQGGQVIATPNSGKYGTYVTLSNTPDTNYVFESYSITGAPFYNRESFYIQHNDAYVEGKFKYIDPYNPLDLPPYTMRLEYNEGITVYAPVMAGVTYGSVRQVSSSPNIWDFTYEDNKWSITYNNATWPILPQVTSDIASISGAYLNNELVGIIGANTTGVTNMNNLCYKAKNLEYVNLFDTHLLIYGAQMFMDCYKLTEIPTFDFSNLEHALYTFRSTPINYIPDFNFTKVNDCRGIFHDCNVSGGILRAYNQLYPTALQYYEAFEDCTDRSAEALAELAQIPESWK